MTAIDLDARYTVDGYRGIAFYLTGYATMEVERSETWEDPETGETLYEYWFETVEDPGMVVAVMVGDDREHIVDVDDLTRIEEDGYCPECGQIGCKAVGS